VCRVLRVDHDLPILVLTARSGQDDLLLGLDVGADDYLSKPYDPRELVARVRSLLRRAPRTTATGDRALRVGPLRVDPASHTVHVGGRPVACTRGEFALIATLAAAPDRVFTRRQLLEHIRHLDSGTTERGIDMHVSNLRRKIGDDPRRPAHLQTVHGVGYKLTDGSGR
jgi:DNA-binding response OmpR family regulator